MSKTNKRKTKENMDGTEVKPGGKKSDSNNYDEEFTVEAIRGKRVEKGRMEYFIKWMHWPESSNTWEPVENLTGCAEMLQHFHSEEYLRIYRATAGKHDGFSQNRKLKSIVGADDWGKDEPGYPRRNIHYVVEWENFDTKEFIPSKILAEKAPQKLIEYLHSITKW